MDEPCSALDPIATAKIEALITELAADVTIVLVTHNMFQAARVSDYTAVFLLDDDRAGELVEVGDTATSSARRTTPARGRTRLGEVGRASARRLIERSTVGLTMLRIEPRRGVHDCRVTENWRSTGTRGGRGAGSPADRPLSA